MILKHILKSNQKIFLDYENKDENENFSKICLDNNSSIISKFYS